jgi:putative oxidoreductase
MLANYESKPDSVTQWALRVSVAFAFVLTGADKFTAAWVQPFEMIGIGQWFRYFTGGVEIVGGLLFLWPAATTVGALLLVATMVGAMVTQAVIFRHPLDALFPGLYLAGVTAAFLKLRSDRKPVSRESRRSSS